MIKVRSHIQFCIVCGTSHDLELHPTIQAAVDADPDARRLADELAEYGRKLVTDGKIPLCERCGAFRQIPFEDKLIQELETRYTRLAGRAEQVQALAAPGSSLKPPP